MDKKHLGRDQLSRMMEENKPVKIREKPSQTYWESCVKEYLDKQAKEWREKQ